MNTRPKDLGTRFESAVVTAATNWGLTARRLAEGGRDDEGDVEIVHVGNRRHVIECKARAALSLHEAYNKAAAKAMRTDPDCVPALAWRRLVRKDGNTRRTAAGPDLVAISLTDYFYLLAHQRKVPQ